MEVKKYHWWHMVFLGEDGNVWTKAFGFETAGLTSAKIKDVIDVEFFDKKVLMSNAIYLGYMTQEENETLED